MTCFWDGILQALEADGNLRAELQLTGPASLVACFKAKNTVPQRKTTDGHVITSVLWQGQPISKAEMRENLKHVRDYEGPGDGHLTSACDPFLILLSHLTDRDVEHKLQAPAGKGTHTIRYRNVFNHSGRAYRFSSNLGHFRYTGMGPRSDPAS